MAVAARGYVRGTADLDLVPDPDPESLKRVAELLGELKATLPTAGDRRFDPASDTGVIRRGGNVTADTSFGGSMWFSGPAAFRATRSSTPTQSIPSCSASRSESARWRDYAG